MIIPKSYQWILACTFIFTILVCLSLISLDGNSVYFLTPSEAKAKQSSLLDKTIKIGGLVKEATVFKSLDLLVQFTLTDKEGTDIPITYRGTTPDMFKEGSGVIVEGQFIDNHFMAVSLMVKHSEEYVAPSSIQTLDRKLIEKSMFSSS